MTPTNPETPKIEKIEGFTLGMAVRVSDKVSMQAGGGRRGIIRALSIRGEFQTPHAMVRLDPGMWADAVTVDFPLNVLTPEQQ